jgi:hypothetical protein
MVVKDTEKEDECTTQYETHLFTEAKETLDCIASLSLQSPPPPPPPPDVALHRLRTIFDKYLECPTLLDQSLELLVEKITRLALHILHSSSRCDPTSSREDGTANDIDDATSSNSVHFTIRYHLSAS